MAPSIRLAALDDLQAIQHMNKSLFEWDRTRDPDMNFDWPYQEVGETYFRNRIGGSGSA